MLLNPPTRLPEAMVQRREVLLTLLLVLIVIASRLVALPATIWDQDEAYLAAAVIEPAPAAGHPFPPYSPLWILLGRAAAATGLDPARGLQIMSLFFSIAMVPALIIMWSVLLPHRQAILAALLFSALPGPWLLAGRAFAGTAATALLVLAMAFWIEGFPSRLRLACSSVAAGSAILIRPQLGVALFLILPWIWWRTERGQRRWLGLPFTAMALLGAAGLVARAGSPGVLVDTLRHQTAQHLAHLGEASRSLAASGLAASLGGLLPAVLWVGLAAVGLLSLLYQRDSRLRAALVLSGLLPVALSVWLFADPGHARNAVPLLALSSGFVVAGIARLVGGFATHLVVAGVVVLAAFTLVPELAAYRREPAPVLEALGAAEAAVGGDRTICVDRRLQAFVEYEKAAGRLTSQVLFDHVAVLDGAPALPGSCTVAVLSAGHPELARIAGPRLRFVREGRWLGGLICSEFRDVTVVLTSPSQPRTR
ncbi:MAG: hypothetical protein ACC742_03890 [Thermoanaerobaculales bacterium]